MSFLYPSILWALAALLIPIAVHLFNFRRHKTVYFSNTAVLKTIQQENAKTKKLKYLVTLLLRCLFIVGLVLAFAFPYKPETTAKINTEEGLVGVYIDNSMSMKAQSSKTTLLEDARESARQLVGKFAPSTRFLLRTNSFEVQNEYPMNQEEMLDQIDRMEVDGLPVKMNEVIDRFTMLSKRQGFNQATLFAYSDFQKNMLDLSGLHADTALQVVVVPVQSEQHANLSIDSVWLASPVVQSGLANEVQVLVSNRGGKTVKGLPVNLSMEGKVVASATVDVEENSSAQCSMQFVLQQPGFTRCSVTLSDYPIVFDDVYHFVLELRPHLDVVELSSEKETTSLAMVFNDDPLFNYTKMNPTRIDLGALSKAQLVVVDHTSSLNETMRQALLDNAAEGASVVFFHDDGKTVDTNTMSVSDLALQHEFFNDIILDLPQHPDLPKVMRHVRLTPEANATVLMHLDNGDPLLAMQTVGKGRAFDYATTLEESWSTLPSHSLFVPMMLKMAFLGGGIGQIAYTLGDDKSLFFSDFSGGEDLKVRAEGTDFEAIPVHELRNNRLYVHFKDLLPQAGFYDLMVHEDLVHVMAWNDSRKESDLTVAGQGELQQCFASAGLDVVAVLGADEFANRDLVQAMARQSSLWRWFVLLALLAALGEILVLRFWK